MKIIVKIIIPLILAVTLIDCSTVGLTATSNPADVAKIALAIAETGIAMTQTTMPTVVYPPTVTLVSPTAIPPEPTKIPPDTYADKVDYATDIAKKNFALLPYYNEVHVTGALGGCVETNDFSSFVTYLVAFPNAPLEKVKTAFEKYLQTEKWDFTEANHEVAGNPKFPKITYDVYRISSKDKSAFERLEISLDNWSFNMGRNYIYVRATLTHIETKENFSYLTNFYCPNGQWAEFYKP